MLSEMSELAQRIETLRKRKGWSQTQLSSLAGLADSTINDIVRRPERASRISTIQAIADALGVSAQYLLGESDAELEKSFSPYDIGDLEELVEDSKQDDSEIIDKHIEARKRPGVIVCKIVSSTCWQFRLGIGDVVYIDTTERPTSGQIIATRDKRENMDQGKIRIGYLAEPYIFRFNSEGKPIHDFAGGGNSEIIGVLTSIIRPF